MIAEEIPEDMPDWMIASMANGKLFRAVIDRVNELELEVNLINHADCSHDWIPDGCDNPEHDICDKCEIVRGE